MEQVAANVYPENTVFSRKHHPLFIAEQIRTVFAENPDLLKRVVTGA